MKPWLALVVASMAAAPAAAAVLPECLAHAEHGRRAEARDCYVAAVVNTEDPRLLAEAYWRLGDRRRANGFFRRILVEQPEAVEARVAWGRLFLESHNPGEAEKLFQEALERDPKNAEAHLGLALALAEVFDEKAVPAAKRALALDPGLREAHVLLARLALEEDDPAGAAGHLEAAEGAGRGSPRSIYALRAAVDLLGGKAESPWTARALALDPTYGEVHATPARFFVLQRRYAEAVALYEKAVAVDPELASAQAALGVNLWRMGDDAGARRHLARAYATDPFDPVTVNSLRLLDTLDRFETVATPRGVLRLHEKEAGVLKPYAGELLEKAIDTFSAKYAFKPDRKIRVEVYPDHDDFAVRTLGLPGLGALGVAFGHVVAMDSPSGRPPGSFHWGSTLWHELNHVFVLESTGHRAPRWIVEGLAVYEESIAGEGWGDALTPDILAALREKKLLPVLKLDRGFVRPDYPAQVAVSYYQAGALVEMIAGEWGFPKLLAMLEGYAAGKTTAEVIQAELGVSPDVLDKRFLDRVSAKTKTAVGASEREWPQLMKTVNRLVDEEKLAEAVEPARRARDLYPDYTGEGNAYEVLAAAALARQDRAAAIDELQRYRRARGRDPEVLKKLATLCREAGRRDDARAVLEQLLFIAPGDEELHSGLGDLWLASGDPRKALREFETWLAVPPLDPVEAHYKTASAYHRLQDRDRTREHLLLALEQAPGHRPAQKLLLEIHR